MTATTGDEPARSLELGRVEVDVTIAGCLARTTTTLTFENPGAATLEGELIFPLPVGATVSGYGLDLGGQMADAVVVERQAARIAFEDEVRRGIDPGLVEHVRGNSFRTRVWPIPAYGRRVVKIEYVSELRRDSDRAAIYELPLRYSLPVPEVSLRLEVVQAAGSPEVRSSRLPQLRFEQQQGRFVASARLRDEALSENLVISLPRMPQESALVEGHDDGRTYFVIDALPPRAAPAAPTIARPCRVGLLWDASLSHSRADAQKELAVLRAWLAALGDVEVALTVFREVPEPTRTLVIRGGDAAPLLAALESEPLDGGTSLAGLPAQAGVGYYVLVSDGLATLSRGLPDQLGAPIFALTAARPADHAVLEYLARRSGGLLLDLASLTPEEAAARIGAPPAALVSLEYDRSAVTDVLPAEPARAEGRVTVTGRLLAPQARLTLRYRAASGETTRQVLLLRRASGKATGLVPRFWAQRQAAVLSIVPERHHAELLALGQAFGIVTPATSLLVLETLDQYLRHGIEPPKSSGELRTEYLKLQSERRAQQARTRESSIERALSMWQERVAWWESKPSGVVPPPPTLSPAAPARPAPPPQRPRELDCAGAPPLVQGRILDSGGEPIPGATVFAVQQGTGAAFQMASASDGSYGFCTLPSGLYSIRAELTGFNPSERQVRLPARGPVTLDLTLEVGALTETVSVTAEAPQVSGMATSSADGYAGVEADESPAIHIQAWDPDTPYLAAMRLAGPAQAYAVYLNERPRYSSSPAFFLDVADHLLSLGDRRLGLRVLVGVLELGVDDPRLLRVVAHRLQQVGELDLAVDLFERVLRLRPEEPQAPHDLALALAARGDAGRQRQASAQEVSADYLRALELLELVALGEWSDRFPGIEVVALMDANRLIAIMEREKLPGLARVTLPERLRKRLDVDLRITLTWDTDDTDMDLWVTEPTGEKCFYEHRLTAIGGMISDDFTAGYGPEEYLVRRARPGDYRIQANFYSASSLALLGPTTAQATVITRFGRPDEARRTLTLRLKEAKDVVDVGSVDFGASAPAK